VAAEKRDHDRRRAETYFGLEPKGPGRPSPENLQEASPHRICRRKVRGVVGGPRRKLLQGPSGEKTSSFFLSSRLEAGELWSGRPRPENLAERPLAFGPENFALAAQAESFAFLNYPARGRGSSVLKAKRGRPGRTGRGSDGFCGEHEDGSLRENAGGDVAGLKAAISG